MNPTLLLLMLADTVRRRVTAGGDRERGDVPGWVLITIMTAGIVTVLWAFASPALKNILESALNAVTGPGDGGAAG